MTRSALLTCCVGVFALLTGCVSPTRIVRQDAASVVIAVPENTNVWPSYYRDEARKAAEQSIGECTLVGGTEVKVGETVTNSQNVDRRDLGGQNKTPKIGEITTASNSTTVQNKMEYHMEFQAKRTIPGNTNLSNQPPVPGGPPITPAGGVPNKREEPRMTVPPVSLPGNTPPSSFPTTGLPR